MRGHPGNSAPDVIRKRNHGFDVQLSARDLAVIGVRGNNSAGLDLREQRHAWRVVAENIERVFAGVKSSLARLDFAIMLEGLANFELVTATLHVRVETLEGNYFCVCLFHGSISI
jgi:hypothetical protein